MCVPLKATPGLCVARTGASGSPEDPPKPQSGDTSKWMRREVCVSLIL